MAVGAVTSGGDRLQSMPRDPAGQKIWTSLDIGLTGVCSKSAQTPEAPKYKGISCLTERAWKAHETESIR